MKFYDALLPANQNDRIEIREAEPYSYCQFVMGRDHTAFGRARHPWLTGSGGWNYTAATRWILGIRLSFEGLIVDPCIPAEWKGFHVTRQWRQVRDCGRQSPRSAEGGPVDYAEW
jgi:N,N'-diacetylchitobiose phosphorylase